MAIKAEALKPISDSVAPVHQAFRQTNRSRHAFHCRVALRRSEWRRRARAFRRRVTELIIPTFPACAPSFDHRNTAFTYKGRSINVRIIGRELTCVMVKGVWRGVDRLR